MIKDNSVLERRERLLRFFGFIGRELGDWRVPFLLSWRHGLDPFDPDGKDFAAEPLSQDRVAERLGTYQQHVARLEAQALDFIRDNYAEDFKELYAAATA